MMRIRRSEKDDIGPRVVVFSGSPEQEDPIQFCDNSITTSKYNLISFIPLSLFEQFRRQGNQYFLLMSVLMLIGTYTTVFQSPISPWTTLLPLIFVLAVSMAQEGYADWKRHQADDEVNNSLARVANPLASQVVVPKEHSPELSVGSTRGRLRSQSGALGGYSGQTVKWKDLRSGNLVVLKNGDQVPADTVLLATSEAEGIGYIETSQIDGETNLKLRRAAPLPMMPEHSLEIDPPEQLVNAMTALKNLRGTVEGEAPNPRINTYEGNLILEDNSKVPLDIENVMLRGSSVRNTSWAIGLIIFTGKETKVVLNSRQAPSKLSELDKAINRAIQIIFLTDIILCTLSASFLDSWESSNFDNSPYLGYESRVEGAVTMGYWPNLDWQEEPLEYYRGWLTFIVLYNNFIPISMYVTVEVVVFILLYYVNNDLEMYHEETDTPAKARSSNITDLGQIQYIFSDKTGTLTQNVMRFKRCSVGGCIFGEPVEDPDASKKTKGPSSRHISQPQVEACNWRKLEELIDVHNDKEVHDDPRLDMSANSGNLSPVFQGLKDDTGFFRQSSSKAQEKSEERGRPTKRKSGKGRAKSTSRSPAQGQRHNDGISERRSSDSRSLPPQKHVDSDLKRGWSFRSVPTTRMSYSHSSNDTDVSSRKTYPNPGLMGSSHSSNESDAYKQRKTYSNPVKESHFEDTNMKPIYDQSPGDTIEYGVGPRHLRQLTERRKDHNRDLRSSNSPMTDIDEGQVEDNMHANDQHQRHSGAESQSAGERSASGEIHVNETNKSPYRPSPLSEVDLEEIHVNVTSEDPFRPTPLPEQKDSAGKSEKVPQPPSQPPQLPQTSKQKDSAGTSKKVPQPPSQPPQLPQNSKEIGPSFQRNGNGTQEKVSHAEEEGSIDTQKHRRRKVSHTEEEGSKDTQKHRRRKVSQTEEEGPKETQKHRRRKKSSNKEPQEITSEDHGDPSEDVPKKHKGKKKHRKKQKDRDHRRSRRSRNTSEDEDQHLSGGEGSDEELRLKGGSFTNSKGKFHSDDFLKILCLCNTVVVEKDKNGEKDEYGNDIFTYQAESPDEAALVDAAKELNYELKGRTTQEITAIIQGETCTFQILAVNKFDSYRKRMSIVLHDVNEGRRWLLCKGADTAMLGEGCAISDPSELQALNEHLKIFATEGLRTLVCGVKELSDEQWNAWSKQYNDAITALEDRDKKICQAANDIEMGMQIVGATAIEDKLQDGVPDTIANLAVAGIKLWVLTGDKRETAINIGFSCKVLRDNMNLQTIKSGDEDYVRLQLCTLFQKYVGVDNISTNERAQTLNKLSCGRYNPESLHREENVRERLNRYANNGDASTLEDGKNTKATAGKELALIMEGPGLLHILGDDTLEWMLFQVADQCNTVIACRVSPKQKALLVRMVKKYISPTPVTLAIGDGANDVNMIQEAQVGIGISGNEGQQAVNSSDFAIAQFRFLKPLLLVHGRWNYRRVAKVVLYSFYKNLVLVETLFFFGVYCGFSGTAVYDQYVIAMFNFFLGLPIIAVGIFDCDISRQTALDYPEAYFVGRENRDMSVAKILTWIFTALLHGILIYWGCTVMFSGSGTYNNHDLPAYGTILYSVLVMTMNLKVLLEHKTITFCSCPCREFWDEKKMEKKSWKSCCSTFGWTLFFWIGSLLFYFIFLLSYSGVSLLEPDNFYGVGTVALGSSLQWLYLFLVPIFAVGFEVAVIYYKQNWMKPDMLQVLAERDSMPVGKLAKLHASATPKAISIHQSPSDLGSSFSLLKSNRP